MTRRALEWPCKVLTDRNLIPYEKSVPFPTNVDPNHILSNLRPDLFVRGPDNCVEYCKEVKDVKGQIKYVPVNPAVFSPGDVIEIAFSCVGVPVKGGQYRLLLNLRAVTLVSDECRKKSEQASVSKQRSHHVEAGLVLKRKRLYVDVEDPSNDVREVKREWKTEGPDGLASNGKITEEEEGECGSEKKGRAMEDMEMDYE
ncbi:hypothetical protein EST38_g4748 [Candolleomyces aberdarensis]|uniref:Uncharacterized protein n=1 Tax=Candolleomyces aberdarensis TaxID=2316362 RepID=A0A4Q2DNX5_9AGAR|nr:hypothetical protein EST38_g4748 [Candolleomyces aberdarensis]